jgi:hypothetical protein
VSNNAFIICSIFFGRRSPRRTMTFFKISPRLRLRNRVRKGIRSFTLLRLPPKYRLLFGFRLTLAPLLSVMRESLLSASLSLVGNVRQTSGISLCVKCWLSNRVCHMSIIYSFIFFSTTTPCFPHVMVDPCSCCRQVSSCSIRISND